MAVQNCIGDASRGATWVALHNGGGVGWGEVMNGGFGHVLDGSDEAGEKARKVLAWDVSNGIARRCWSGKILSMETKCVGDNSKMLMTVLAIATPKSTIFPLASGIHIQKVSPTSKNFANFKSTT